MILKKSLVHNLFEKSMKPVNKIQRAKITNRSLIGNRDWVGFGKTGAATYEDDVCYPFPAIRFKENSNELLALREKEKGDWRKLTIDEKKTLYRASFRQTFSEIEAPTGEWKSILGWTLFFCSLGIWLYIGEKWFVYGPLPKTFNDENRRSQLRRMLTIKAGHLTGVSSQWDYENDTWKK